MKRIIIALFALAALAGCSKSGEPEPGPQVYSQIPIRVASMASVTAETRTPYTGTISNTNKFTARVLATRSATDWTDPVAQITGGDGPMTFTGQDASYTLAGAQQYAVPYDNAQAYYPANANTNVYLAGLYPAGGWAFPDPIAKPATISRTFDGSVDLMTAPQVSTNKNDAISSPTTYRNLAFTHRLTLLEVQVVATGSTAITKWGALQYLQLTGVQGATPANTMTVDLTDNSTSFSGSSNLFFYVTGGNTQFFGQSYPLTTTPQTVAYCIVPPVTISNAGDAGYTILARTTLNQTGASIPISISTVGSTEGKRITVTITFDTAQAIAPPRTHLSWENYDRY